MAAGSPAPWQAFFSETTLGEAESYVADGLVHELEGRSGGLTGMVQERRRSYFPVVSLISSVIGPDGVLRLSEMIHDCQCANAHSGCAHAAAVLLGFTRFKEMAEPALTEIARARVLRNRGESALQVEDQDRQFARQAPLAPPSEREHHAQHVPGWPKPSSTDHRDQPSWAGGAEESPMLAARFIQPNHPVHELENWLHQHFRPRHQEPGHLLTYHLHAPELEHDSRNRFWTLELVAAKRLKSGGLGVHRRFRNVADALELGEGNLQNEDQHLLNLLEGLLNSEGRWQGRCHLDARLGATGDLLERIIATGRAYAEDFAHPLTRGPLKTLHERWRERAAIWHLELADEHGALWPLIPVRPPWYIAHGECGPTTSRYSEAHLSALSSMPPLQAAHLPAVLSRLRREMPNLPVPPAIPAAAAPQGHLVRVRAVLSWSVPDPAVGQGPGQRCCEVEMVCLLMRYGSLLCAPGDTGVVTDEEGEPLLRDPIAEQALLRQLEQLGLVALSEIPPTWSLMTSARIPGPSPARVHLASLSASAGTEVVLIPALVLGALVAAGWTLSGRGPAAPIIPPAVIEATFHDAQPGGKNDWFQLDLGIRFGNSRVDLTPVLTRLLEFGDDGIQGLPRIELDGQTWVCLALLDGSVVRVPLALLSRLVDHLLALYDAQIDTESGSRWTSDPWQAIAVQSLSGLSVHSTPRLNTLVERLQGLRAPADAVPPAGFQGELRPYQLNGLAWMSMLRLSGVGGILADDMGLGKTVQAIAHICAEHAAGRLTGAVLVVGPASMVGTWQRELSRFAPHLALVIQHGTQRARRLEQLAGALVVVTTYATLLRDCDLLAGITWSLIIADEAQFMANPAVKSGQALRSLPSPGRLALTGTPLSNHLGELYTLMDWAVPGLLGTSARFDRAFRKPIEEHGDAKRAEQLRARIAPFLLRRTKEVVAPELPPRSESVVTVTLEGAQRALYESVRLSMHQRIREVVAAKGLARSRIEVFEALTKLRMCCCDPRLVKMPSESAESLGPTPRPASASPVMNSAKLEWLSETLPQLIEEGRRILLFSQFTSWLDLVESDVLAALHLPWVRLDGSTRRRDAPIARFQSLEVPLFLLSLKAGGTGLTLTAADTVIISDPWWNPAAEDQAGNRAHRIGQDKPVFIYRLVTQETVEERILELQRRKRTVMAAMLDADGQAVPKLTDEDLALLLAPLPE